MTVNVTQEMLAPLGYGEEAAVKEVQASYDEHSKKAAELTRWQMAALREKEAAK